MHCWHFILIFVLMTNLAYGQTTQPDRENREIEYYVFTRGYTQTIKVNEDSIVVEEQGRNGNKTTREVMPPEQWKKVMQHVETLSLKEINELPSPTNKRQSDAAMHARLTITTKDQTYTSAEFDAGTPPKPLDPLVQLLLKLSNKKE